MKRRYPIFVLLAAGCGVADPEEHCPSVDTADLECPAEIDDFEISACERVPDGPGVPPQIDALVTSNTLHVEIGGVLFRDNNEVCGFAERQSDEVRVLLQPCVLVPEGGVSKGDCWYASLAFEVGGIDPSGAQSVTILHRVDRSVELPPYPAEELGSAALD
ncbi:MAG TPA: hypothetical protein VG755_24620 [Nannocystaceae bacterium]|nr:hypothetical protein [Nannocystaceae bacterium]